jgi:hypothetical protein
VRTWLPRGVPFYLLGPSVGWNLLLIFAASALALATWGWAADLLALPWLLRVVGLAVLPAATLGVLYRRGDVYGLPAVILLAYSVVALWAVTFVGGSTVAGPARGAGNRMLAWLTLAASAFFGVLAWGLPNPGLFLLAVASGSVAAVLVLGLGRLGPGAGGRTLLLGGLLWAQSVYAWMADASPVACAAPFVLLAGDAAFTLVRRLFVRSAPVGRRGLARLAGRGAPRDDTVLARLCGVWGRRIVVRAYVAASGVGLLVALAEWQFLTRVLPGTAPVVVVGALALLAFDRRAAS